MAERKATIRVQAKGADQAKRKLDGVGTSLSGVAKKAGLAAVAFIGVAGLVRGMKAATEAAGEQERAEKALESAIGGNIDKLKSHAAALQQVTTFGDEVTLMAQAQLAAFTKDQDAIASATEAVMDFAVAQGMDLNNAMGLVAKTLGSSTNSLIRYGVQVDGAAGSAERLESITQGLTSLWGGRARTEAETYLGQMEQMKNAVGDAAESIGFIMTPAIIEVSREIKNAAEFWGEFLGMIADTNNKVAPSSQLIIELNQAVAKTYKEAGEAGRDEAKALGNISLREGELIEIRKLAAGINQHSVNLSKEAADASWSEKNGIEKSSQAYSEYAQALFEVARIREELAEARTREGKAEESGAAEAAAIEAYIALLRDKMLIEKASHDQFILFEEEEMIASDERLEREEVSHDSFLEQQNAKAEAAAERMRQMYIFDKAEKSFAMAQVRHSAEALAGLVNNARAAANIRALIAVQEAFATAQHVRAYWSVAFAPIAGVMYGVSLAAGLANAEKVRQSANFAEGGRVGGSGFGDSVPANLTPGEFVNTRQTVDRFGPEFFEGLERGEIPAVSGPTIIIQGNIIGEDEYVRDRLLPALNEGLRSA
jgi:hypothetical protein